MGRPLQPFSYWHKIQLEYVQSVMLTGGRPPELWDYWIAAKICSTRYPQNVKFKKSYSVVWRLAWHLLNDWRGLRRQAEAFSAYLEEYASPPKLWAGSGSAKKRLSEAYLALGRETQDEQALLSAAAWEREAEGAGDGKDRQMDDSLEQVGIFMRYAGRSSAEAWNMPLGELLWYNCCLLKMEGAEATIWTPRDEQAFEQFKVKRFEKISAMADEILIESPHLTRRIAEAQAAVNYWEKIVSDQTNHSAQR